MARLGDEEWRAHAELVGRVTIAWNHCTHQLLRVFRHLTGFPPDIAGEIFLSHRSDQGQRYMLKRLVAVVDAGTEPRAALLKHLKRLETISSRRNLAAHTIFGFQMIDPETSTWSPKVVPALPPELNGKLERDFVAQFERAERDLQAVYWGLEQWLDHSPYPPRPWGTPMLLGEPWPYVAPDLTDGETWPMSSI
jgi:hypothetical protein